MASIDWSKALDLARAVANIRTEFPGDWHQDPWGWPELGYLLSKRQDLVYERCNTKETLRAAVLDVPKENWGTRPAVVLDIIDKVAYQALVDRVSVDLVGPMSPNVFGWRLPAVDPRAGVYSHNNQQWDWYRKQLGFISSWYDVALRTDLVSFFASIPMDAVQASIQDKTSNSAITKRLCEMVGSLGQVPGRSGLPQRSLASAVLANMFVLPLDDVLHSYASPHPKFPSGKVEYSSLRGGLTTSG